MIREGKIEAVVHPSDIPPNVPHRDFDDAVIMPGLVDPHVHINEPGRTEWEGFRTATRAAAAGGVTTLIDMPLNNTPVTTTVGALKEKRDAAMGQLFVDCGFYGGLVPGSQDALEGLIQAGVFGIKAFLIHSGIDDFPAVDLPTLKCAMPVIARSAVPLLAHAELEGRSVSMADADWTRYETYLRSRPDTWETEAISLLAQLASHHACRTHIVHLATTAALPIINEARRSGVPITVEVCSHHLYFDAASIGRGQTLFKCAPPIRERDNNDRLLEALLDGQIDLVTSDHSPTTPSRKAMDSGDFRKAWGGIASVQLRLPVIWTLVRARGVPFNVLSRWLAERPADFLGIGERKGRIEQGRDADFVIWDPEASFTVTREGLHDRHRLTPYENEVLFGCVIATYLRGRPVFQDGSFREPNGRLLARTELKQARTKMERE